MRSLGGAADSIYCRFDDDEAFEELYDHSVDAGEDDNLCFPQTGGAAPCVHGGGVDAGVAKRLRRGWRGELPPAAG